MIDDGIGAHRVVNWKSARTHLLASARRVVADHSDLPSLLDLAALCLMVMFVTGLSHHEDWAPLTFRAACAMALTAYCVRIQRWYLRRRGRSMVSVDDALGQASPGTSEPAAIGAGISSTSSASGATTQLRPAGPQRFGVKQYAAGKAHAWCYGDSAYGEKVVTALRCALKLRVDLDREVFASQMRLSQVPEGVIAEYLESVEWDDEAWLQAVYPS